MIIVVALVVLALTAVAAFSVGFQAGADQWRREFYRLQAASLSASRRMGAITRAAFVAMAEAAERRHP
jgi:hypothetical protein